MEAQLGLLAGYLLKENAGKFEQLINAYNNAGGKAFAKENKKLLATIIDVDFLLEEEEPAIEEIIIFLAFAVQLERVMIIDWSGEEYQGQAKKGIAKILASQGALPFKWKNKNLQKEVLALQPKRGEYLPLLFRALNEELEQEGWNLGFIDIGQDCYYYFVLPKQDVEQILQLEGKGWKILDTNIYEIYLTTTGAASSKLMLYLKNKFNIPLHEIKTFLQQESILVGTGNLSIIDTVKKELESLQAPYQVLKQEAH